MHDASCLELALFLQDGEAAGLLELALAGLALCLFALSICETGARLGQHLLLVLVHVDGIGACRLGFRVGVDFARTQAANVVGARTVVAGASKTKLLVLLCLRLVEQLLVSLETLDSGAADDWGNGTPLGGHELCEVEELLVLGL